MFRRPALFAAFAILAPAAVQVQAQPMAESPAAASAPMVAPSHDYDDQQMRVFAGATLDLQALGSQDPAAMTHVIEARGMSVRQYNEMGDAMRADKALEARLAPFLRAARTGRAGGYTAPPAAARRPLVWNNPYVSPRSARGSRHHHHRTTASSRRHHSAAHSTSHKAKTHKAKTHKAKTHKTKIHKAASGKHRTTAQATAHRRKSR
jgi:hypothetical protein